jgi:hypothetical protein
MFAVEHPLDLRLAEREQERNIKSLLLIELHKGLKDFTTESQRYRESTVKDYREVAKHAKKRKVIQKEKSYINHQQAPSRQVPFSKGDDAARRGFRSASTTFSYYMQQKDNRVPVLESPRSFYKWGVVGIKTVR